MLDQVALSPALSRRSFFWKINLFAGRGGKTVLLPLPAEDVIFQKRLSGGVLELWRKIIAIFVAEMEKCHQAIAANFR